MKKKGVSAVVATVILIALTFAIISIVWAVVNNLVSENIESSESCFGVFGKVTLNQDYTCYNNTVGTDELWFSINVGNIEKVDDILVAISGGGTTESFRMLGDNPAGLFYYPNRTGPITIPGKNQGRTYIYELPVSFTQIPDKIEIAPVDNDASQAIKRMNRGDLFRAQYRFVPNTQSEEVQKETHFDEE